MAIQDASERISSSWHELTSQWSETCQLWTDVEQQRFARQYWEEFQRTVPEYIQNLTILGDILRQVEQNVH